MNVLVPANAPAFLKRFQFTGAAVLRFGLRNRSTKSTGASLILKILDGSTNRKVKLRMDFVGVDEYRLQRRPGSTLIVLKHVNFGEFEGLTYFNFDGFPDDGPPKVMDFRASDFFVGASRIEWSIVEKPNKTA
jgi:hypothetical protein